jgi:hypothetical protein
MDGALRQAAEKGQEVVVYLLLKHMVDVDAKDEKRMDEQRCTGRLRMGTRQ